MNYTYSNNVNRMGSPLQRILNTTCSSLCISGCGVCLLPNHMAGYSHANDVTLECGELKMNNDYCFMY